MFDRILLAIDHSGHSHEATRIAAGLAVPFGSLVRVVHMLEAPIAAGAGGGSPDIETEVAARALVSDHVARLASLGVRAEGVVDERGGLIAGLIVDGARIWDAGLTVVGAAGPGALNPLAIGSVAHAVVSRAGQPVLVVRQAHRLDPGRLFPVITVGIDGSPEALRAAALGTALAARLGSELQLLHAVEARDVEFDPDALLADLATRAAARGVTARWELATGDPATALDLAAGGRAGGLIVVGRRGLGMAEMLGGVAHRLLRTTWMPVLVSAGHTDVEPLRSA